MKERVGVDDELTETLLTNLFVHLRPYFDLPSLEGESEDEDEEEETRDDLFSLEEKFEDEEEKKSELDKFSKFEEDSSFEGTSEDYFFNEQKPEEEDLTEEKVTLESDDEIRREFEKGRIKRKLESIFNKRKFKRRDFFACLNLLFKLDAFQDGITVSSIGSHRNFHQGSDSFTFVESHGSQKGNVISDSCKKKIT